MGATSQRPNFDPLLWIWRYRYAPTAPEQQTTLSHPATLPQGHGRKPSRLSRQITARGFVQTMDSKRCKELKGEKKQMEGENTRKCVLKHIRHARKKIIKKRTTHKKPSKTSDSSEMLEIKYSMAYFRLIRFFFFLDVDRTRLGCFVPFFHPCHTPFKDPFQEQTGLKNQIKTACECWR